MYIRYIKYKEYKGYKDYGGGKIMSEGTSTAKARADFSDLLNRAAYGRERVLINRRGKPFAAIVPLEDVMLLEKIEDQIDIERARKAMAESEGTTSWEDVLRDLEL